MGKGNKPTGGKKDKMNKKPKKVGSKVKQAPSGSIFDRQGDSAVGGF